MFWNPLLATAMALLATAAAPQRSVPNPVLALTSTEYYTIEREGTKNHFIRYRFDVANKHAYPADLFAAAPHLPPCGTNTNAARAWVDFFDSRGKRLYGFCALKNPADLDQLWFALPQGQTPPSYVYIEIFDRQTGTKYRSNLADTTL